MTVNVNYIYDSNVMKSHSFSFQETPYNPIVVRRLMRGDKFTWYRYEQKFDAHIMMHNNTGLYSKFNSDELRTYFRYSMFQYNDIWNNLQKD